MIEFNSVMLRISKIIEIVHLLMFSITDTVWNVFKYGVLSGPYFPAFGLNTDQKKLRIWTIFTQWEAYLGPCQTSIVDAFSKNSYRLLPVDNFRKKISIIDVWHASSARLCINLGYCNCLMQTI